MVSTQIQKILASHIIPHHAIFLMCLAIAQMVISIMKLVNGGKICVSQP